MKSVSKLISTLLNNSMKVTYPFPDVAEIHKNDLTPDYDYYSDISLQLFSKYKVKMLNLWGATNTPPTPQSYSEELLINMDFKRDFLFKISHDFDGKILFTLDNRFVEGEIRRVLTGDGGCEQGVMDINNMSNIAVLMPFGEIVQKLHLNQMRGVNISESVARIYEYFGFKVRRFSCLRNAEVFHGILLNFLGEKEVEAEEKENFKVKFEDLSRFIVGKGLRNQREIAGYGAKGLMEVGKDERNSKLFAKLNALALQDMMKCFNVFTGNKGEPLTVVESYNLNKKLSIIIKDLSAKGRVFYSEEDGYYLTLRKNDRSVTLIDNSGVLTKEGLFLGFLYEISAMHFAETAVFSTDLQDKQFYETIQEAYEILFESNRMPIKLEFYGHNSIFLDQNSKTSIFLSQFLEEIVDQGIKKAMSVTATFPSNLTNENRETMKKMVLGWFRFKDHQIAKEQSYILDINPTMEFIFNNPLVNIREFLVTGLKDFKINEKIIAEFKIKNLEERVLAVKILEFPEILEKVLKEKNMSVLTKYFEALSVMTRNFCENKQGNLLLVKASLSVIGKSLYILGVI